MSDTRFAPHPQVLLTEVGDGTGVLLHLETKFYYELNPTAVCVWKALADRVADTPAALAAYLAERFDIAADDAARDVAALLDELANEGLLDADAP